MLGKFKAILVNDVLFNSLLVLLVGVASFGLGRQSVDSATPVSQSVTQVDNKNSVNEPILDDSKPAVTESTTYVASKNSDKYHLPWCSGAKNIAEANKIYFSSKAEAEVAGYQPAGNCKGI